MTQIKICGLREAAHIETAIDAGADYIGFILYPPARRYIEPTLVRDVMRTVSREKVGVVGIFVNESPEHINRIADLIGLDVVQLGGDEPAELTGKIERPVARTVHVGPDTTVDDIHARSVGARFIHLDARKDGSYGGTGTTFDWGIARGVHSLGPIWLAGGLSPDNVEMAIATAAPTLVDVSSGVEIDGRKDSAKILAFVTAVRRAVAGEASISR